MSEEERIQTPAPVKDADEQKMLRFLDDTGRIKQMPAKYGIRVKLYAYLAEKFEAGRDYSEQEINAVLGSWNTVGEHVTLRRGLVEEGYLGRTRDGSRYWKQEKPE